MVQSFENLPQIGKILLVLFFGWIICPIMRIIRWTESKNTVTLVAGILCLCTGVGNVILEILDLVTEITSNKMTVFMD